jgi:hypothetical protein
MAGRQKAWVDVIHVYLHRRRYNSPLTEKPNVVPSISRDLW